MKKKNVFIAAGGTGGHLIPAQQLAFNLALDDKLSLFFIAKGLNTNLNFKKEFFEFKDIASSSFSKKRAFSFIYNIIKGTIQSLILIKKKKADIIIGFGSYHTFPALLAAFLLRKPIVIFESNSILGKVNRFFLKRAKVVTTQFKIEDILKYKNSRLVPFLPWIEESEKIDKALARKSLGLEKDAFTFLVFGGSQGAKFINDVFFKVVKEFKDNKKFQVIHICGDEKQKDILKSQYEKFNLPSYVVSYEKNMPLVYSAADFAICRSGAGTISELIFFEVPSFLIPYPFSSDNHQEKNAMFMKDEVKGGDFFTQRNFDFHHFQEKLSEVIDHSGIEMKENLIRYKMAVKNEKRAPLSSIIYEVLSNI